MSDLEMMHKQLVQVFQYAEMLVRLNSVQELLDIKGGYAGERDVNDSIEKLKMEIRKNIERHLGNSGVSDRARIAVNNADYLRLHNKEKQENTKINSKETDEIYPKLVKAMINQLGCIKDEISMDTDIEKDLGADSLDIVELQMEIEESFNIEFSKEDSDNYKTKVRDIVELIKKYI